MKKIAALIILIAISIGFQKQTFAQATRTWISGVGDDVNPCSRTAPCKTFQGAYVKTAAGGEINILDPGGYGSVTIEKSIVINGYGSIAGILMSGVNGVVVNAGPDDVVILRNIYINGFSSSLSGIKYASGGQLHIENCNISGMYPNYPGIWVEHTGKGLLTVRETAITGPPASMNGIQINTAADTIKVLLNQVNISGVNIGVYALNGAQVNIANSTISGNTTGVLATYNSSVIRLSNTGIFNNTTGIGYGSGKILSFGNNQIAGNGKDWPISILSAQ
jgi:hypothetical protein